MKHQFVEDTPFCSLVDPSLAATMYEEELYAAIDEAYKRVDRLLSISRKKYREYG